MAKEKLITLRKKMGLTQQQLSKLIAMDQSTYSRKELGRTAITENEWLRIAKALNVALEDIKESNSQNSISAVNDINSHLRDNNYINIPQKILDTVMRYNFRLEEENRFLKEELAKKDPIRASMH